MGIPSAPFVLNKLSLTSWLVWFQLSQAHCKGWGSKTGNCSRTNVTSGARGVNCWLLDALCEQKSPTQPWWKLWRHVWHNGQMTWCIIAPTKENLVEPLFEHQSLSININWLLSASISINQYQSASISINQHIPVSISINQHHPVSISINQYQSASISIYQYQSALISINQYQLASTSINQYQN